MANQTTTTAQAASMGATYNTTQSTVPWYSQWQNTYGSYAVSNSVLQTNGTGASQWQFADASSYHPGKMNTGALTVKGTVELTGEDADIVVNGVKLSDTLNAINERLNILHTNKELEADWEDLAELGRQYREKEAWVKERVKLLDILAKD